MGNRKTAINGIGTTGVYKDGDCMMLKNLRQKNGRLVPVAPRKTVKTLGNGYTYLFYHNLPQTGENLLGVRDGNIYLIADSTETLLTSTTGFKSITQIGNLVNVLDGDGVRVLWWSDDHYNVLGAGMDMCPVKVDLRVTGITNSSELREFRQYPLETVPSTSSERATSCKSLISKAVSIEKSDGRLTGIFNACIAVELFDGNYILHSNPTLCMIPYDKSSRYNFEMTELNALAPNIIADYETNNAVWGFISNHSNTVPEEGYYSTFRTESDIRGGIDKGSYSYVGPYGICPFLYCVYYSKFPNSLDCIISSNKLQFKIDKLIDSKFLNVVKSISVFITNEISVFDETKINTVNMGGSSEYFENFNIVYKSNNDLITELKANQQFYKVHEITFDELRTLTPNTWIDIDLKDKLGDNLVNQEELPVDNFTHHGLLPNGQMVYNSKLHVFDYKQTLFKPWPTEYITPQTGVGQFSSDEFTMTDVWEQWIIAEIKTENGISKVVRHQTFQATTKYNSQYNFLSYPDSRARKLTIVTKIPTHGGYTYNPVEFSLTASETHNFAYWISESLKPVTPGILPTLSSDLSWAAEQNAELIYRNALKISSINNPFNFPSDQTHTVGTGVIRNAGTNAMRMSDGQFGQYPLYVLTTEGITSLDTGTTVAYNRQSSASLEIPVSDLICPTPFGVLFIGKRGLYVINGQQVQYLSAAIEENMLPNNIVSGWTNWEEWVSGLKLIAYDYQQHEIVLVGAAYNLIYNVDAKQWYISTEQVDGLVNNTGSELKMYKGMDIKDFSQMEQTETSVELVTRPMMYESDERKNLLRMMLRGRMYNMTSSGQFVQVYGSNDGVNHTLLRAFTMPEARQGRDHKDLDFGAFARATYRNYVLRLVATIDEGSSIDYVESEVTDRWMNDKDR